MDRSSLDVLRGFRILAYSIGAITFVAGLVLLIWPSATLSVVGYLVAALVIGFGLILLWSGYVLNRASCAAV